MFSLQETAFGKFKHQHIINTATDEFVSIIPEFGGVINQLVIQKVRQNYSILNGCANYDELLTNEMYKSSKLVPFPNRIKDGTYSFEETSYHLPLNHAIEGHAIHGLVYDKPFVLADAKLGNDRAQVTLIYEYDGGIDGYPFPFQLSIDYIFITGEGLTCETKIVNTGKGLMPMGDGWHPYFKTDKRVNRLMLRIPPCSRTVIDERMIPTGAVEPFDDFRESRFIGDSQFDTGFQLPVRSGEAVTELFDPELDLKISVFQETGQGKYNFLQIYIPPSRNSIAIEPMTCNIDAFNNKQGLIILKPGETFTGRYGIRIS